jgi:hypothetical protein
MATIKKLATMLLILFAVIGLSVAEGPRASMSLEPA